MQSKKEPSAALRGPRSWLGHGTLFWASMTALFTAIFLLRFAFVYFGDLADGVQGTLVRRVIDEATGAYTVMLLFVVIIGVARRYPLDRHNLKKKLGIYAALLIPFSITHTVLIATLRALLFPIFAPGESYPLTLLQFAHEAPQDVISYSAVLAILALVESIKAARRRELRELELQRELAQAELATLRYQLQPHFLFNALNTIAARMYDDPAAADAMIGHLSDLLRQSLGTSSRHEVPLGEELAIVDKYIAIMKARFGAALDVRISVPAELLGASVPSLLLQPLVENAIRHGAVARAGAGYVDLTAKREGDSLSIRVENDLYISDKVCDPTDLAGREPVSGVGGIGLRATSGRLRLLYESRHDFAASSAGDIFTVSMRIPYRESAERDAGIAG